MDVGGDVILDNYDGIGFVVVVVGFEGKGILWFVFENCDIIMFIFMVSDVESFNVFVVCGVVFFEFVW